MDVVDLRAIVDLKFSNRSRPPSTHLWLMGALDAAESPMSLAALSGLAEYVYNSHYPIEGLYCYVTSATSWEVIFILEAGYMRDLCVCFQVTFPTDYPEQAPVVRVSYPAQLIHPLIHPTTGEVNVVALLRSAWDPATMCTVHIFAAIKVALMAPCLQPFQLTAESRVLNQNALDEYLVDPSVTLKWRSMFIESLRTHTSPAASEIDTYIKGLTTGTLDQTPPALAKVLQNFDATLQTHVDVMLQRMQLNHDVSFLKLVSERVPVVYEDLHAYMPPHIS